MEDELKARWQGRIKTARRFSRITKVRIFLTFVILPVQLIIGLPDFFESGTGVLIFVVTLGAFIAAMTVFRRGLSKYRNIESWPNLKPISQTTTAELDQLLVPLTKEMEFDRQQLKIFVDFRNYGTGPSVIESRRNEEAYVVIPLGYLKLLKEDRAVAEAIMAHELSHLCQHDTNLWFLVTAFGRSVLRVLVPFNVLMFLGVFVFVLSQDLDGEWPLEVKTALIKQLASIVLPLAFYYSVTKMRKESEKIADLGAAAFSGIENVQKALTPYLNQSSSSAFSFHPSARERSDALARLVPRSY